MNATTLSDRPMRVAVIDDDSIDQQVVTRAFRKLECEHVIDTASNGEDGLELLRRWAIEAPDIPFVVLLDLRMPRMDGFEFLEHVRRDPDLRNSVIFVYTTSTLEDDRDRAYGFNVAGYIVKPQNGAEVRKVAELIERYRTTVSLPIRRRNDGRPAT
ncbi:MAG: response regulator [Planctomycetes bacterium]|nr:response regulator [Planctomycetota bacterium]